MGRLGEDVTTNKVYIANTYGSDNSFIDFRLKGTVAANSKMIITGAGLVGIATTSPSYTLHVNGSVAGTSAYNNLSDARLKKDIGPISGALALIDRLRGVRFSWRTPQERDVGAEFDLPIKRPQIGFVAQEVGLVLPEAVTVADGKDAIMSMQETKIVPILVEAVKELSEFNKKQAEAILDLKHEVAELRHRTGLKTATARLQ